MSTWSRVNGTGAVTGSSSGALRATLSLTPGNLVVVGMANFGGALTPSDGSNTYIELGQITPSGFNLTLYYTIVTTGGTLTIGSSTSSFGVIGITQFSPGGGTITVDGAAVTKNATSTSPSSGSIPITSGDLVVGVYSSDAASTTAIVPTSPTLVDFNAADVAGSNIAGALLYELNASGTSAVLSGSIPSTAWAVVAGAFKSTAIGFSVTGPTSGTVGRPSANFTLTPAATTTGTVTPSDGGKGGTFTPPSFTFNASGAAQTFTYTPTTTGEISLTLTSADGGVITGSPLSYTSAAPDPPPTGTGVIPELGFQFSAPITGDAVTFTVTVSATQASVPGTTTYNSGTQTATFTPTNPFVVGTKYLAVVSGATAADGTPMVPATFPFTPGSLKSTGWFAGLSRPI
jgi:hypothetical protein